MENVCDLYCIDITYVLIVFYFLPVEQVAVEGHASPCRGFRLR